MSVENIQQRLNESARHLQQLTALAPLIESAAQAMTQALHDGKKILFCGNGGSAADSQHLAAEFMGRFLRERTPLPAIALTTDTSILTAIGNDYGYEKIFSRQISAIGHSGDILLAISTSGNSANIIEAAHAAKQKKMMVIALTGEDGGSLSARADIVLATPARRTDLIQEMHIVIGHILCGLVETAVAN